MKGALGQLLPSRPTPFPVITKYLGAGTMNLPKCFLPNQTFMLLMNLSSSVWIHGSLCGLVG